MTVRFGFEDVEGNQIRPLASEMADVQTAFVQLSGALGMPRLDRTTVEEFARRAELYQAYVGYVLSNGSGPQYFGLRDFLEMLKTTPVAWTNWTKVSKRDFDADMKREREAYWKYMDSKK